MANEYGITLDDAISELQWAVEDAHNFMVSEFNQDWEQGEAYYAGKCDLPIEAGRSSVVKTETRDVIRAIMPNVMRIMLQAQKPVEYMPSSIRTAAYAEQQALWVNHLFAGCGGYDVIYNAALESMKLKSGPVKVYWDENANPEHIYATGLSVEELTAYDEQEDIIIDEVESEESPTGGETYSIRATRYYENGRIRFESFPVYEFFTRRNSSDLTDLHGHMRTVTVSEALEMGLEHGNWRQLDDDDPKENDASEAETQRRGYTLNQDESLETDLMNHEFLLTEAYYHYDMDGDGVPEKYVFYFGGSGYEYLHHEKVEDFCIALVSVDPQPFTVIGRSVADLTKQSQDNETSILRAIVDNAHQANNPRPAADPSKVNFEDLMNNKIGAPIRTKGEARIQYTDTPFTAQGLLPFLEYLERDAEMRVGVTKAAQGLDPDAMQSTDKQAVLNTIQLSQGQIELIVRNIINTGLIPLFRMALRLATRHMDKNQMMRYKGAVVPVDIALFDPDLVARPNVGLGTTSPEQKLSTLQFVYAEQQRYMETFGLDNPFTSLRQVYNTLEDMIELGGITDVGRYFNYIDAQMEAVIGQQLAEQANQRAQAEQENMPLDPGKAHVIAENTRAKLKQFEIMSDQKIELTKLQQRALETAEEYDFKRDDMAQERVIELAKIGKEQENDRIKREQGATSPKPPKAAGGRSD